MYMFICYRNEIGKIVSGESSFDEISDLISHVPFIVVITGSIIFMISFAGLKLINSMYFQVFSKL